MSQLSNKPPKGMADWWPDEFAVRSYIFETWRRVNRQFGYEEYMTPVLENADIYRAKSGEDVGGKELMTLVDRGGREMAIRPEMTPSVTRMVTRYYKQAPKPLRLFSIANFVRNERPQRGRNREFWQLNSDIFGTESTNADLEILQLALEIMLAFDPPPGSFNLNINHRSLIDAVIGEIAAVPDDQRTQTVRILDKFDKLPGDKFAVLLDEKGLPQKTTDSLTSFMQSNTAEQLIKRFPQLEVNVGYREINTLMTALNENGYGDWVVFNPSIIRGFDYYDGMVFEIFDNHPDNNRALFGGGRYNGLGSIFGASDLPAVGFAPGDETLKLFLEAWGLVPERPFAYQTHFFPLLDEDLYLSGLGIVRQLRQSGLNVEQGVEKQSFRQAFKYADSKNFSHIILYGTNEAEKGVVALKDLHSGEQVELSVTGVVEALRQ